MKKHLVLAGGGHAHLKALLELRSFIEKGHEVTLISPSPYHYYSAMGPGMLSGLYQPGEIRFNVKKMSEDRGATFVQDSIVKIHPRDHTLSLHTGGAVPYDAVSFNTGR